MKLGKSTKMISVALLSSVVLAACSDNSKTTNSSTYEQKIKKLEKQQRKLQAQVEAQEKAKAEAEKRLKDEAETATKNLEDNQTNNNVTPAQTAVDKITDQQLKASFQNRINAVKNAISQREEQARIAAEQEAQRQAEQAVAQQAEAQRQAEAAAQQQAQQGATLGVGGAWSNGQPNGVAGQDYAVMSEFRKQQLEHQSEVLRQQRENP
ncbi:hypothetical protein [Streptococcus hyointestinalis]|uniref:hypothetical protein n=1 Tax=Streptococcus hyointestinalis TaxID=1337 RepID=UPI0013DECB25|nr:hypothetical protein [Streptococcus hyointestinalis]